MGLSARDRSDGDYERDPESQMPWLPAQRALAYIEEADEYDTVRSEILALPNIVVFFKRFRALDGSFIRVGDSILMDPKAAAELIREAMPARCEYVTGCDCEKHEGRTMTMLDPEEALR